MKLISFVLFAVLSAALPASAQVTSNPPVDVVPFRPTTSTATITLGESSAVIFDAPRGAILAALPPAPFTFRRGTHLQIVMPVDGITHPVVTFYKDDNPLPQSGTTLDIATLSTDDSGRYYAKLNDDMGTVTRTSEIARVLVTETGADLVNYSTRAELSATQRSVLCGFVVQPGPATSLLLIRAVGPALAQFGVTNPLATPRLRLLNSAGQEVPLSSNGSITILPPPGLVPTTASSRVGAFPLPPGGKDIEQTFLLGPGAYTAEVTAADGGGGTVLLEVYQIPI